MWFCITANGRTNAVEENLKNGQEQGLTTDPVILTGVTPGLR